MWNIAGVNGKNDSVSLLWVTNHAFQAPRSGETAVYIEKKNTISSDVIVVRRLAATGSSFLSTGERKVCGVLAGVGGPTLCDSGTSLPVSGKDFIPEMPILTVVAPTEGNDTAVL
jgi:hypothetical protein